MAGKNDLRQPWRLISKFKPARSLYRSTLAAIAILVALAAVALVVGLATATAAILGISAAIVLAAVLLWAYANLNQDDTTRETGRSA